MPRVAAIVPAAGAGRRLGARLPKAFARLGGRPLIVRTLQNLSKACHLNEVVVASPAGKLAQTRALLKKYGLGRAKVVAGGKTRAESVANALREVSGEMEWVLVHDAARPFVGRRLVARLLEAARETGAALCAIPVTATVKRVDPRTRTAAGTEDRTTLVLAQTPQVFRRRLLAGRYRALGRRAFRATDEAALFDGTETRVKVVEGDPFNIKITTPFDLKIAERFLKAGG